MTHEAIPSSNADAGRGLSDGLGMRVGPRYVVTRPSVDGEFLVGDRIRLLANGDVLNCDAGGWMSADDVPSAMRGVRVAIDVAWVATVRETLESQLQDLMNNA
jgi:hypothetical protein